MPAPARRGAWPVPCGWRAALWAVVLVLAATCAAAADPDATELTADSLAIEAGGRLVAEGSVQVLHRGARLQASRLIFERGRGGAPDRLEITGPITLEDGARIEILADAAAMSTDLRDGVLERARLTLDRRLRLDAERVEREAGRFTRLDRAVTTSCRVCPANPVPLWEIRAARVTHDAEARTLHFDRAAFRVAGRTLVVIPRLRMPDPGVRRATGFLAPDVLGTSALGPGIRLPWFLVIDDQRDLTLSPRAHARGSATLGLRYRQAIPRGRFEIDTALTRDRLRPGRWRGHLEVTADAALTPDTVAGLRLQIASDARYRNDYGLGDEDIRTNTVFVEHARRDGLGRLRVTQFRSFRDGDENARLPNRVLEAGLARRVAVPGLGGRAWLRIDALAAARADDSAAQGVGRDLARLSLRADWRRDWLLGPGVQAAALGALQADHWRVRQDDRFDRRIDRLSPAAAVELRWPLLRHDAGGATHLLEPVAQLVWARPRLPAAPVEDARLSELDDITLFRLQRGPGLDAQETGARANLGIGWTRHDPAGWSVRGLVGRVLRDRAVPGDVTSGLAGRRSDWLAALRLDTAGGLALAGRALIGPSGGSPRQDLRLGWTGAGTQIAASYLNLAADPARDRARRTSELGLDAAVAVGPNWTALADLRYDIARDEPGRAGLGARFRNECLAVDVSLSRRFVSSTSVAARTEVGLRVDLLGFGAREGGPPRPCAR